MSTKLTVSSLPNFRKSTLALHRINSMVNGSETHYTTNHDGFDDLRHFIKAGGEFSKELASTLSDRAELEATYAKGLAKLASKLYKASNELSSGSVANAWHFIAEEMASSAETHKTMAVLMTEDLVKPLRHFAESQNKSRKSVESHVDKSARILLDWRTAEAKTRSKCHTVCKENERVQDAVLDCKLGRGRGLSDKELIKLDSKRKKSEEAVRKSDLEYYSSCIKAERARLEWESAILRGCSSFQRMEEDRLNQLRFCAEQYQQILEEHRPKLVLSAERLHEPIRRIYVGRDMEVVRKKVEIDENSIGEQSLPNFYAEDRENCMNHERRKEALAKFLRIIKSDIDRETKGLGGVENLAKAIQETPKFGGEESQQDVQEKLGHMRSMLTFLEASRYKVLNAMLEMDGRPKVHHPLSSYIEQTKDKSGFVRAKLKIPYWDRQEPQPRMSISDEDICMISSTRSPADGSITEVTTPEFTTTVMLHHSSPTERSNNPLNDQDSSDFDDFSDGEVVPVTKEVAVKAANHSGLNAFSGGSISNSSSGFASAGQEENEISEIYYHQESKAAPSIGQCKALYDYSANMYDELSIKVGDVINIHDKQEDGWWLGELRGQVGIFPATYVEDLSHSS